MKKFLQEYPEMLHTVWNIMNRIDPQHFIDEGRVYGGGLRKVEPAELMNIPVPEIEGLLMENKDSFEDLGKPVQMSMFG
jgi:hypothetical protein